MRQGKHNIHLKLISCPNSTLIINCICPVLKNLQHKFAGDTINCKDMTNASETAVVTCCRN